MVRHMGAVLMVKQPPYRNQSILDAANGENCTLQSSHCNHDPATTVFAHLNYSWAGKGFGQKAHDFAGAFMCSSCHAAYDAHKIPQVDDWTITRAMVRTLYRLFERGVIGG